MTTKKSGLGWTSVAALMFAAAAAHAQPAAPPAAARDEGISDVGAMQQVPYGISVLAPMRAEEKATLRKLEDRQIQELRALEDRFEKELRALRAKQYAERDAVIKSFARR